MGVTMGISASILWLIAGAAMLALEAFGLPGIGFVFAGLGALMVGVAIEVGLVGVDNYVAQFAVFFAFTSIFAVLLWKKLKAWRMNPRGETYQNMIGETAVIVLSGLQKGARGQVRWSGTVMQAELDPSEPALGLAEGTMVRIVAVKGNVLYVRQQ